MGKLTDAEVWLVSDMLKETTQGAEPSGCLTAEVHGNSPVPPCSGHRPPALRPRYEDAQAGQDLLVPHSGGQTGIQDPRKSTSGERETHRRERERRKKHKIYWLRTQDGALGRMSSHEGQRARGGRWGRGRSRRGDTQGGALAAGMRGGERWRLATAQRGTRGSSRSQGGWGGAPPRSRAGSLQRSRVAMNGETVIAVVAWCGWRRARER